MGPAVEHKHELVVRADSWYMRVYGWVWDGDANKADFCKLFWAFFPPFLLLGIIGNLIGRPFAFLATTVHDAAADYRRKRRNVKALRENRELETKPERKPSVRMQKLLLRLEVAAVKSIIGVQKFAHGIKRLAIGTRRLVTSSQTVNYLAWRAAQVALFVAVVGTLTFGIGLGAYEVWMHFTVAAMVVGIAAAAAGLALGIVFCVTAGWAALIFMPIYNHLLEPSKRGVAKGGLGFVQVLRMGYVAAKSNTCPRITIKE